MAADENLTTSRLLNRLAHDIDTKAATITPVSGDFLLVYDISVGKVGKATTSDLTLADLGAIETAIVVGADDTGYDVKFFGATAGKSWLWDESADKMIVTGASDLLGNTQQTGTFTVGVDDTGHDVKFFGATTGKSWLWDESADKMVVTGDADITGNVALTGSIQNTNTTAVTAATGGSIPVLTFTDGLNLVSFTTNADDIVHLPTNVAGDVGKEIEIYAVQGFELRSADTSATLNNVVIGATNECAFVAGTYARLKCVADNTWLAIVSTLIDGTQTKLVPDAV